jgi:hypothetical protein
VQFLLQPENQDKIDWENFTYNPNIDAIQFVLQPENKVNLDLLNLSNPLIFKEHNEHEYILK